MKRYGNNLPASHEEERFNEHGSMAQVIRGGCGVRYEMLNYIQTADQPKKHKPMRIFSLFKFGQKKIAENDNQTPA